MMCDNNEDTAVVAVGDAPPDASSPSITTTNNQVSSYFDCGTRNAISELLGNQCEEEEDGLDETMTFSDLSDPSRSIWIVTTAALPWRTGTAVNPFLRALYFVKRRLHLYQSKEMKDKPGKVTLVIPWLLDLNDAQKLYGDIITRSGQEGKEQQLEWIKNYADEMCNMKQEMEYLNILFYNAAYWPAFGSIFPTVDICSLIPSDEADVAILEEPEHLNWMRVPDSDYNGNDANEKDNNDDDADAIAAPDDIAVDNDDDDNADDNTDDNTDNKVPKKDDKVQQTSNSDSVTSTTSETGDGARNSLKSGDQSHQDGSSEVKDGDQEDDQISQSSQASEQKLNELGWAHKFKFVVGVIHTNYTAYMKQYGIGTTIVAAPVIKALSSMVVRAYCHKVIRLSGVIPSYAKWKEVTCNVHGVRGDFLDGSRNADVSDKNEEQNHNSDDGDESGDDDCAPIYFIGKLLWAKGFDKMLKVQETFRKARPNKEYFRIDVYGGGPDEIEIRRAFHGRLQPPKILSDSENASVAGGESEELEVVTSDLGQDILMTSRSIRSELLRLTKSGDEVMSEYYSNAKNYINAGFEVVVAVEDESVSPSEDIIIERRELVDDNPEAGVTDNENSSKKINPISILSDVSGKSISTGIATTKAVKSLADSALKAGLAMTFTQDELGDSNHGDIQSQPSYRFDPPKTIYELRRTPLPARFLGVKDHAMLREMKYKIFMNPSITEVLCTTTAEALAMGKFVIIPKHISNEFFFQFPNCLAYETLRECVEMIQWALDNEPSPLMEEEAHIFTWDAATDRMIEASIVTKREARDRNIGGFDKADSRMAWIHSQGGKKSNFIKTTFFGQAVDKDGTQKEEIALSEA